MKLYITAILICFLTITSCGSLRSSDCGLANSTKSSKEFLHTENNLLLAEATLTNNTK